MNDIARDTLIDFIRQSLDPVFLKNMEIHQNFNNETVIHCRLAPASNTCERCAIQPLPDRYRENCCTYDDPDLSDEFYVFILNDGRLYLKKINYLWLKCGYISLMDPKASEKIREFSKWRMYGDEDNDGFQRKINFKE